MHWREHKRRGHIATVSSLRAALIVAWLRDASRLSSTLWISKQPLSTERLAAERAESGAQWAGTKPPNSEGCTQGMNYDRQRQTPSQREKVWGIRFHRGALWCAMWGGVMDDPKVLKEERRQNCLMYDRFWLFTGEIRECQTNSPSLFHFSVFSPHTTSDANWQVDLYSVTRSLFWLAIYSYYCPRLVGL